MQEFIYYSKTKLDFPLDEEIFVTSNKEEAKNTNFLISNCDEFNCEVNATEIDFYVRNTKDPISKKIENIHKLYEIAALKFDLGKDISYTQDVSNRILLIASEEDVKEFVACIQDEEFDLFSINEDILKSISGHIGALSVVVDDKGKDFILNIDQIVWFDAKEEGLKQSGCLDPNKSSIQQVVETLRKNINNYEYKKILTYNENICQYHQRRNDVCGKCADVCPSVAIAKDEEKKHIKISQIDCHGCGGCVSICPSGAVDYAPMSKDSIFEIAKEFSGFIPLIIPEKMDIANLEIPLKEGVFPFKIDGEKFLHEATFLTILQESGSQIVFFTDFISKGSGDAIGLLNEIYMKKYGKKAIFVAMNEQELKEALNEASLIENSSFSYDQEGMKKREIFSIRLSHLVGSSDLGSVKTGEYIQYAKVNVDKDKCTLCLSCVGACNVDALKAFKKDNTLRINPSLCTACGYCTLTCPEDNCLNLEQNIIELNPAWFTDNILASDDFFACVECGKDFATKKAIEKVAKIFTPIFANDEARLKTLYCCENCKAKVMFSANASKNQLA